VHGHELGILVGARKGAAPGVAYGGALSWGIGDGAFPLLRASARYYETHEKSGAAPELSTHFRVISLELELCLGRRLADPVALALCSGLEAGQYLAEAETDSAVYVTHAYQMFWAEAHVSAPLRLTGDLVFAELQPELRFPLVSGKFELQRPDTLVHEIPRVAVGLNLELGVRFH
jgi:hypothetical protein